MHLNELDFLAALPNRRPQIEPSSVALPDHLRHTSKDYMALVVGTHQMRIRVGYLIEIEALAWLVVHCFDFDEILEKTVSGSGNCPYKIHSESVVDAVVLCSVASSVVVADTDSLMDNTALDYLGTTVFHIGCYSYSQIVVTVAVAVEEEIVPLGPGH